MSGRQYFGPSPSDPRDLTDVAYINAQIAALNLSQVSIDNAIAAGLAGYVNQSYVDTRDALNAPKSYVDAGDATRLHLSQIGANSGVVGLNSAGHIDLSRLNLTADQKFPLPYTSPGSPFFSSAVTASTETTVGTPITVTDPGYPYKIMAFGVIDAKTETDGYWPVILVRSGSTSGPVVAYGLGNSEHYSYSNLAAFLVNGTYNVVATSATYDAVVCGAGGGGSSAAGTHLGKPGLAGHWAGAGLNVTVGQTLTLVVGLGGALGQSGGSTSTPGSAGGASSVSGSGFTTLSGAGGAGGVGQGAIGIGTPGAGLQPGDFTFDGITYPGGQGSSMTAVPGGGPPTFQADGTAPGAGGSGGARTSNGTTTWQYGGANGGDGGIFLAARTPPGSGDPDNAAPVNIMPIALESQSVLTGNTLFYIRVAPPTGVTASVVANTFKPNIWLMPVPA